MKTTDYFKISVPARRPDIKLEWIEWVVRNSLKVQNPDQGRVRPWASIAEAGTYLRVVGEPAGETVHNAFCDRRFKPCAGKKMAFEYHPDSDRLSTNLANGASTESAEIAPDVVLDFAVQNHGVGVEIEDARKLIDLSRLELKAMPINNLILSEPVPTAA